MKFKHLAITVLALCSACKQTPPPVSKEAVISGEVFIATKSGENVKMGLVDIYLYKKEDLFSYLEASLKRSRDELEKLEGPTAQAKSRMEYVYAMTEPFKTDNPEFYGGGLKRSEKQQKECDEAQKIYVDLAAKQAYIQSASYIFDTIPSAPVLVTTDSDGKYNAVVSTPGDLVVMANAKRQVGSDTENYYWIVPVTIDKESACRLTLSNKNLLTPPFDALLNK